VTGVTRGVRRAFDGTGVPARYLAGLLGAKTVPGLCIGAAVWLGIFTLMPVLISGHVPSLETYAEAIGGYIAGCLSYRCTKWAWTNRAMFRRG
jgi:hypothetical protein